MKSFKICAHFKRYLTYAFVFWSTAGGCGLAASSSWKYLQTDLEASVGHSAVQSIAFSNSDVVWVGTQGGLEIFDEHIAHADIEHRVTPWSSDIVGVVETSGDQILALSHSQGLYLRQAGSDHFETVNFSHGSSPGIAQDIAIDDQDNVWLSGRNGLRVIHTENMMAAPSIGSLSVSRSAPTSNLLPVGASTVCFAVNREVRCARMGGRLEIDSERALIAAPSNCSGSITALAEGHSPSQLIAGTDNGALILFRKDGLGRAECVVPTQLHGEHVTALLTVLGTVFVATQSNLYSIDPDRGSFTEIYTGRHRGFRRLIKRGQDFWVLAETGLALIIQSAFAQWPPQPKLDTLDVTAFAGDGTGNTYVGAYDKLYISSGEGREHALVDRQTPGGDPPQEKLMSMAVANDSFFLGTRYSGLHIYSKQSTTHLEFDHALLSGTGITVLEGFVGGVLIGTFDRGLFYFSDSSLASLELPRSGENANEPVTSIHPYEYNESYRAVVVTENAVLGVCFDSHPYVCRREDSTAVETGVRFISAYVDNLNILWLGTLNNGLYTIDLTSGAHSGTILKSAYESIADLSVYSILSSNGSTLWLSTDEGIWMLNLKTDSVHQYSSREGVEATDFNHAASHISANGEFYFGSPNGYVSFLPDEIENSHRSPRIHLRTIGVGDIAVKDFFAEHGDDKVVMPWNFRTINLAFSVGELVDTSRTSYQVRLDGFTNHWSNAKNQSEVTFNNLPPGDYMFRARGADSSGVWSSNEIRLPITVLPPWWQTRPAYLLYFAFALLLLFLLKRANENRTLRNSRDELEVQIGLQQEQQFDELQQQIESTAQIIERAGARTFDMLDCIDDFVDLNSRHTDITPEQSRRRLEQRIAAIRLLQAHVYMRFGEAVVNLNEYTAELFSEFSAARSSKEPEIISVNGVSDTPCLSEHAVYVAVVLRELIENAYEHAFPRRFVGAIVTVEMEAPRPDDNGNIVYRIVADDNGRGLDDDPKLLSNSERGLGLVARIADRFEGAVELADVGGTRVEVTLRFINLAE